MKVMTKKMKKQVEPFRYTKVGLQGNVREQEDEEKGRSGCCLCKTLALKAGTPDLLAEGPWIFMFRQFRKELETERDKYFLTRSLNIDDKFQVSAFNPRTAEWLPFQNFLSFPNRAKLMSLLGKDFEKTIPCCILRKPDSYPYRDMLMAVEGNIVACAVHDGNWKQRRLVVFKLVEDGDIIAEPLPEQYLHPTALSVWSRPSTSKGLLKRRYYVSVTFHDTGSFKTRIFDVGISKWIHGFPTYFDGGTSPLFDMEKQDEYVLDSAYMHVHDGLNPVKEDIRTADMFDYQLMQSPNLHLKPDVPSDRVKTVDAEVRVLFSELKRILGIPLSNDFGEAEVESEAKAPHVHSDTGKKEGEEHDQVLLKSTNTGKAEEDGREEEQAPAVDLETLDSQIKLLQNQVYVSLVGVLCGYSVDTKSWSIANVPPPRDLGYRSESHYVVWKDSQSGRVFMAASMDIWEQDMCYDIGFEVWELKPTAESKSPYKWQCISSTPASLFGASFEAPPPREPDGAFHYLMDDTDNPVETKRNVYFGFSGTVVCMTVADHTRNKFFPRGSYSCPLFYDIDGNEWSRLQPPPASPCCCWSGYVPLFVFNQIPHPARSCSFELGNIHRGATTAERLL